MGQHECIKRTVKVKSSRYPPLRKAAVNSSASFWWFTLLFITLPDLGAVHRNNIASA
ncbi:hypothetical protein [Adhaeribacter arboris]|uniref:hypothetical protein n=1 Tax=Adhaeribacter arboris TaxID=2072846 RepID=UPI001304B1FA|nr:hypothetical protein [Adhaeribacter arboris]